MMSESSFCLKWDKHRDSIIGSFDSLRNNGELVDVTFYCEDIKFHAHQIVLSACSPFFKEIFKTGACRHPVFYMPETQHGVLAALLEFMYSGSVNVTQQQLPAFISAAERLQVRGLAAEPAAADEPTAAASNSTTTTTSVGVDDHSNDVIDDGNNEGDGGSRQQGTGELHPAELLCADLESGADATGDCAIFGAHLSPQLSTAPPPRPPSSTKSALVDNCGAAAAGKRRRHQQQQQQRATPPPRSPPSAQQHLVQVKTETASEQLPLEPTNLVGVGGGGGGECGAGGVLSSAQQPVDDLPQQQQQHLSSQVDFMSGEFPVGGNMDASLSADISRQVMSLDSLAGHSALSLCLDASGVDLASIPTVSGMVAAINTAPYTTTTPASTATAAAAAPQLGQFPCRVCGRRYRTTMSRYHHEAVHRGRTVCQLCGRVQSRVANLRRHLVLRHGFTAHQARLAVQQQTQPTFNPVV